jgi:hypothetical protein
VARASIQARDHGEPSRAVKSAKRRNGINVQVIRSYSWAAAESPKKTVSGNALVPALLTKKILFEPYFGLG